MANITNISFTDKNSGQASQLDWIIDVQGVQDGLDAIVKWYNRSNFTQLAQEELPFGDRSLNNVIQNCQQASITIKMDYKAIGVEGVFPNFQQQYQFGIAGSSHAEQQTYNLYLTVYSKNNAVQAYALDIALNPSYHKAVVEDYERRWDEDMGGSYIEIRSIYASNGVLIIPSTIKEGGVEYPVKAMYWDAIQNPDDIWSVSVPASIARSIDLSACSNLKTLEFEYTKEFDALMSDNGGLLDTLFELDDISLNTLIIRNADVPLRGSRLVDATSSWSSIKEIIFLNRPDLTQVGMYFLSNLDCEYIQYVGKPVGLDRLVEAGEEYDENYILLDLSGITQLSPFSHMSRAFLHHLYLSNKTDTQGDAAELLTLRLGVIPTSADSDDSLVSEQLNDNSNDDDERQANLMSARQWSQSASNWQGVYPQFWWSSLRQGNFSIYESTSKIHIFLTATICKNLIADWGDYISAINIMDLEEEI